MPYIFAFFIILVVLCFALFTRTGRIILAICGVLVVIVIGIVIEGIIEHDHREVAEAAAKRVTECAELQTTYAAASPEDRDNLKLINSMHVPGGSSEPPCHLPD